MDDEYQLYHQSGSFVSFLVSWSSSYNLLSKRIAQLAKDIAQAGFWQSNKVDIMDAWLTDLHSVETIPFDVNWKPIRSYLNSTVTILYEDRVIDPNIPSTCKTFYYPNMDRSHVISYYQQLWRLAECFDLVKEYEQKMNIRYELLIRARSDSVLDIVPRTLEPLNNSTLVKPNENDFGCYNDRFSIGSMSIMEKYMRRWHDLSRCHVENLHTESFLKLFLNRFNINVQLMTRLSYKEQPH
ncbi:unnamed protein product, partial [Rotaria sp. Silwood1]